MLSLVISIIFIISKVEAKESAIGNPEIRLVNFNAKEDFTVRKDEPLKIIIENSYPRYVWCSDFYANSDGQIIKFVPDMEFQNDIVTILNVTKVTAEMSTRWKCTVLQTYAVSPNPVYKYKNKQYTAKEFHFNLYVKRAKAVSLSVNNYNLTYVTTDLSVSYDGEANYTYVDGEDLQISCKMAGNIMEKNSTLRLEYYNAAGIRLFRTKPRDKKPHVFGSVLKSSNDNYYLDCIHSTHPPEREYRYRTKFLMKKENLDAEGDQHAIILSVNGQNLTSISKEKSYDDYIFRYIHSGLLEVSCQKMGFEPGPLVFYEYKDDNLIRNSCSRIQTDASGAISLCVSTSNLTNKTLMCSINNTEVPKPNARILFLHDELARDIRLRGLPSSNVMYEYTNGDNQWTIEYQYSVNETFNVTCEGYARFQSPSANRKNVFKWKFEGQTYDSRQNHLPNDASIQWSETPFTKILEATHNRAILQCIYFPSLSVSDQQSYINHTVELIFRLKPEPSAEVDTSEDARVKIVVIATSVGTIGIITVICLVLWRKRSKRTRLIESESDNLSNQNNSPIPAFPSQWETDYDDSHYYQIDEGVMEENEAYLMDTDKPYKMPYKRQSNNSENHYTEIDDNFKPKPGGLAANWRNAVPGTQLHNPISARNNNSKQGIYDNLRHDNLPIVKGNANYSNVQQTGKIKNVTFEPIRNEFPSGRSYNQGTSRQGDEKYDPRLKQNGVDHYVNTNQGISMQPRDLTEKHNYENDFVKNVKPDELDYAEPYGHLGIRCKNDFYR